MTDLTLIFFAVIICNHIFLHPCTFRGHHYHHHMIILSKTMAKQRSTHMAEQPSDPFPFYHALWVQSQGFATTAPRLQFSKDFVLWKYGRHEIWGVLTTLFDKEVVHSHVPWASDCNARQKHKKWWKWRFEHVLVEVLASMFGIEWCLLNYALISIISIGRFYFEVCFTFSQPNRCWSHLVFPIPTGWSRWLCWMSLGLRSNRVDRALRRLKRSLPVTSHCSSTLPLEHDQKCKVHKSCRVHGEWAVGKQNEIIYMSYTRDVYRDIENCVLFQLHLVCFCRDQKTPSWSEIRKTTKDASSLCY